VYRGSASGLVTPWGGPFDGGLFGYAVATAGDVDGDGYSDVLVGQPFFTDHAERQGRAWLSYGTPGAGSEPWTVDGDRGDAELGRSLATAGDVNGDGYSDVLVAAPFYDEGEIPLQGRVWLYHGSAAGAETTAAWTSAGPSALSAFGESLASAGDVNGDGYADVILGAYLDENGQADEGRAFVHHGSAAGLAPSPAWTVEGDQSQAYFGSAVASAGDVNGDGYSDVIVGALYHDNGEANEGRAYVYHGSPAGLSPTPAWQAEGGQPHAHFGHAVASAGDVNGDGHADVLVGAYGWDNGQSDEGRALVYHGSPAGLSLTPAWTVEGNLEGAQLGLFVASAGDVNRDGYSDVILNRRVYYGSPAGLSAASEAILGVFAGRGSTAGDFNGDGCADVIWGDPAYQAPDGTAILFWGCGGDGLEIVARQVRTDGTAPIALLGTSDDDTAFLARSKARTPAGRGRVRLAWEVEPLGTPFDGAGLVVSDVVDTGAPGPGGSAAEVERTIDGLAETTSYRWRVRSVGADPFFPRSPWRTVPWNNVTEAKLRTAGCFDADGDGYGIHGGASCASAFPDCADGDASAWATPGPTRDLRFTSQATLAWDAPSGPGAVASSLRYDVLRAAVGHDFLAAACVESADGPNTTAIDRAPLAPGSVHFYLARARNACPQGVGSLGTSSDGVERPGTVCP
jgi:hypothetical protein